jgi:hypothetical protein
MRHSFRLAAHLLKQRGKPLLRLDVASDKLQDLSPGSDRSFAVADAFKSASQPPPELSVVAHLRQRPKMWHRLGPSACLLEQRGHTFVCLKVARAKLQDPSPSWYCNFEAPELINSLRQPSPPFRLTWPCLRQRAKVRHGLSVAVRFHEQHSKTLMCFDIPGDEFQDVRPGRYRVIYRIEFIEAPREPPPPLRPARLRLRQCPKVRQRLRPAIRLLKQHRKPLMRLPISR